MNPLNMNDNGSLFPNNNANNNDDSDRSPVKGVTGGKSQTDQDSLYRMICDMEVTTTPLPQWPWQLHHNGETLDDLGLPFHPLQTDLSLLDILDATADEWLLDDNDVDQLLRTRTAGTPKAVLSMPTVTLSSTSTPTPSPTPSPTPTSTLMKRSRQDLLEVEQDEDLTEFSSSKDSFDSLVSQVTLLDEEVNEEDDTDNEDEDITEHSQDTLDSSLSSTDSSFDALRFRSYQTGQWATRYNELVEYRALKGHCVVPHTYEANLALARWVKRQRYQHKLLQEGNASSMTEERAAALESIGFVWDSQGASWQERLNELHSFRLKHNHCNVPSNFQDRQLATWVKCQRRQFKLYAEYKRSNMTRERIQELEEIGFEWEVRNYKKARRS
jgi:hypothetical protein